MTFLLLPPLAVLCLWGAVAWVLMLRRCAHEPQAAGMPGCSSLAAGSALSVLLAGAFGGVCFEAPLLFFRVNRGMGLAFLAALLSVPCQLVVAVLTRRRTLRGQLWWMAIGGVGVAAAVSAYGLVEYSLAREVPRILGDGRLAPLPVSATGVRAFSWSSGFAGESYLVFRASPEEIESFLAASPSLDGVKPEEFGPAHPHLPYRQGEADSAGLGHAACFSGARPSWYDPTIAVKGREYAIPPVNGHDSGSVVVNDATGTVYIRVVWS